MSWESLLPNYQILSLGNACLHQQMYGVVYYLYVGVRFAREDGYFLALLDTVEKSFGRVIWAERAVEVGVVCRRVSKTLLHNMGPWWCSIGHRACLLL